MYIVKPRIYFYWLRPEKLLAVVVKPGTEKIPVHCSILFNFVYMVVFVVKIAQENTKLTFLD